LADRPVRRAGVFQDRDDEAEGGGSQRDGDEEGAVDPSRGVEREAYGQPEQQRCPEAEQREAQQVASKASEVDLEAGEEQQEGQADQGEDLDGPIDGDPAENRGSEHDAGEDLQDNGGDLDPRDGIGEQRGGDGDERHDEQPTERQALAHVASRRYRSVRKGWRRCRRWCPRTRSRPRLRPR